MHIICLCNYKGCFGWNQIVSQVWSLCNSGDCRAVSSMCKSLLYQDKEEIRNMNVVKAGYSLLFLGADFDGRKDGERRDFDVVLFRWRDRCFKLSNFAVTCEPLQE